MSNTERWIDLNADLGEEITDDEGLLQIVTSANVACGYHAGSAAIMREVCEFATEYGVMIGAHVSYDDRANFGRSAVDIGYDLLRDQVQDQVNTLSEIAVLAGTRVSYVKPHGMLYNVVVDDIDQARAVLDGSEGLPVLGFPGSALVKLANRPTFIEAFPDRGYTPEGRLMPRGSKGAVITSVREIAARAVVFAESVDSVCVHGDSPLAAATAAAVRQALVDGGFKLRSFT